MAAALVEVAHLITLQRLPQPGSQEHSEGRPASGRPNSSAEDLETYVLSLFLNPEFFKGIFPHEDTKFYGSGSSCLTNLIVETRMLTHIA